MKNAPAIAIAETTSVLRSPAASSSEFSVTNDQRSTKNDAASGSSASEPLGAAAEIATAPSLPLYCPVRYGHTDVASPCV